MAASASASAAAAARKPAKRTLAQERRRAHESVVQRVSQLRQALEASNIMFDATSRSFRHRGRPIRGLTPVLKKTLWPNYDYEKVNTRESRKFRKVDTSLRRATDGKKRGTRVHLQLELLTNSGVKGMKRKGQKLHEYTRKLLLAFKKWGWCPITSELPLMDPDTGVATAADLICSGRGGELILVETKTGYYGTWERARGQMSGPLQCVLSDSPRSQALVQCLATKRMIESHGCRVDQAYVVRVDQDGVVPERVFAELEKRSDIIAQYVASELCIEKNRKGPGRY